MVTKIIKYILLIINLALIVFLLLVRVMISRNYLSNDDIFFGRSFLSFQMDYAANFKYIMAFFSISAVLALFLRGTMRWKIVIIGSSIFGLLFYFFSYSRITPW
jgi:hypothetical protein